MELKYNGVTLPKSMVAYLVEAAKTLNVPPSYLITKLHFEGVWGQSNVARSDNNWSGMSTAEFTGTQTRPSGIVVTLGGKRPAREGGYYYKYASIDDFLTDWTYLIRRGGIYKVADSATFSDAVKGMFRYGGAKYDYAEMKLPNGPSKKRYELYLEGMEARRNNINQENSGALDKLDKGDNTMAVTAQSVLNIARKHLGVTKYSSQHTALLKDYNSIRPLPVSYAVKADDDWCDMFVSVVAKQAGAGDLIGYECGVERHKSIFKQKNIWLGLVRPQAGDVIIWRWDGNRNGFANHIGFVESVSGNTITTIEGNTTIGGKSVVGRQKYAWNAQSIQGYARPKYGATVTGTPAKTKEVSQHIVVTIDSLRAFNEPNGSGKLVETITKDLVKNIDMTVESDGYLWGGWISSADGKRRYTTLQTADGKRKFVDIKQGTIGHGGKTYTEYLSLQDKVTGEQPAGGDEPKLGKNEVELDGTVYVIQKK